jgi:hypothetical protein
MFTTSFCPLMNEMNAVILRRINADFAAANSWPGQRNNPDRNERPVSPGWLAIPPIR